MNAAAFAGFGDVQPQTAEEAKAGCPVSRALTHGCLILRLRRLG